MQESDNTSPERPSKSQRKREVLALQKIGETLVDLPASELAKIPLEPMLHEAIYFARTLKTHEAKRRQMQYIGKIMRNVDVGPIELALETVQSKDQQAKAKLHQIERWRAKLIAEGDKALDEFLQQYTSADHQHFRQLIRKAQQDQANNKKTGAETELFRLLRDIILAT